MKTAFIISIILFGIASLIELVFCFMEKEKERKMMKVVLMPILLISVALSGTNELLLYVAIFGALLGDIFLLNNKSNTTFLCGNISFMTGHLIYAYLIINRLSYTIPAGAYFIAAIVIILFITLTYDMTYRLIKKLVISSTLYGLILVGLVILSILLIVDTGGSIYAWMVLGGVIFYLLSDSYLAFTSFIKSQKRENFYIMLTYIIGEALIAYGLVFLL